MDEFIKSLLNTWRDKDNFGLTFPFIVGALRLKGLLDGLAPVACRSALNQLQTAGVNIRLAYCDKANDLILAPVNNVPAGCDRVTDHGNPTSLWVQSDVVDEEGTDSADLFRVLWQRYGSDLESERYSCTKGKYHSFSERDLALIDEAFERIA